MRHTQNYLSHCIVIVYFLVISFGLTNALAAFRDMINQVFKPYFDKFGVVFVYDFLIYSRSHEEHEQHLKIMFQAFKEH